MSHRLLEAIQQAQNLLQEIHQLAHQLSLEIVANRQTPTGHYSEFDAHLLHQGHHRPAGGITHSISYAGHPIYYNGHHHLPHNIVHPVSVPIYYTGALNTQIPKTPPSENFNQNKNS
ncbi:hypothetical protein [Fictibacillus barbaricus]|uniref:Uncharacterized protein n=1 Tax=Fictibacillus barbaricus TaxID=182136 RepID=A0ABS2Z7R8_9BACL|nr:hypothetical protein [Fictibacillus barbaricus]MBN3544105.1 hypothetical protein [Fictibacillus barbaricus]GGB68975.1 hypothetical protein GCM10007199_38950 [Fictibacillus barbaricus]